MYENGRRLNRYARKRRHIDNLKRRTTPRGYASYEQFVIRERAEDEAVQSYPSYYARRDRPEWYEQYWNAYSGFLGQGWKKELKGAAHREERNFWRTTLNRVIKELDEMDMEDVETPHFRKGHRGGDPWDWD